MKTLTHMAACLFTLSTIINSAETSAQSTGDNLPAPGKYLGFSGPQNLEFRTNNTTRMQMMQDGNSTINGFTVNRSGFLGLSQNPNFFTGGAASPFSLLHLNGNNGTGNAQQLASRPISARIPSLAVPVQLQPRISRLDPAAHVVLRPSVKRTL